MVDQRRLAHGEKTFALFTSEKGRDRANARRAIEGLQQGDQSLGHLSYQSDQLYEQTAMFRYMCDRLVGIERQLAGLTDAVRALAEATASGAERGSVAPTPTPTVAPPPPPPPVTR